MVDSYMVWNGSRQPPSPHCRHTSRASAVQQRSFPVAGSGYVLQRDDRPKFDPKPDNEAAVITTVTANTA